MMHLRDAPLGALCTSHRAPGVFIRLRGGIAYVGSLRGLTTVDQSTYEGTIVRPSTLTLDFGFAFQHEQPGVHTDTYTRGMVYVSQHHAFTRGGRGDWIVQVQGGPLTISTSFNPPVHAERLGQLRIHLSRG